MSGLSRTKRNKKSSQALSDDETMLMSDDADDEVGGNIDDEVLEDVVGGIK